MCTGVCVCTVSTRRWADTHSTYKLCVCTVRIVSTHYSKEEYCIVCVRGILNQSSLLCVRDRRDEQDCIFVASCRISHSIKRSYGQNDQV